MHSSTRSWARRASPSRSCPPDPSKLRRYGAHTRFHAARSASGRDRSSSASLYPRSEKHWRPEGVEHDRRPRIRLALRLDHRRDPCRGGAVRRGTRDLEHGPRARDRERRALVRRRVARLEAELVLASAEEPRSVVADAEKRLRDAIAVAEAAGARSLVRRVALSLGRLLAADDRREAGRDIVRPVVARRGTRRRRPRRGPAVPRRMSVAVTAGASDRPGSACLRRPARWRNGRRGDSRAAAAGRARG